MSMLVQPKPASEQTEDPVAPPYQPESDSNGDSSFDEAMPDLTDMEVTSGNAPVLLGGLSDSDSDSEVET